MPTSIFARLQAEAKRKPEVIVITTRKKIEGKLIHVDSAGNLTISSEEGLIFVQRNYMISLTLKKCENEKNSLISKSEKEGEDGQKIL